MYRFFVTVVCIIEIAIKKTRGGVERQKNFNDDTCILYFLLLNAILERTSNGQMANFYGVTFLV